MTTDDELARAQAKIAQLEERLATLERDHARLHDQLLHPTRMEAVGTLAAGLAHDMNNILGSIMGFAEAMLDERQDPRVRVDLEHIVDQAERGAVLTRGLLAFSRKGQYRKQVLDLAKVIRDVLPLLGHTLPKTIAIESAATGELAVLGDPVQLVQTLINLGLNSADAMEGAGTLSITAEPVDLAAADAGSLELTPGRHARIRVTDTGGGMDEATRARVFEPFFTTKPIGKGTGLGLSTVWGVVKAHGGAIRVESEVGRGTTFLLWIPITAVVAQPPAPHAATPATRPAPRATILVVDDEATLRATATRLLEKLGHHVLGASNGAEAVRVASSNHLAIDLIILDMGMPVMGGAECFHRLRELTSAPILIATGYAIDEEIQALVARGAFLIEKPFGSTNLVIEVTRILANRGARS